MVGVLRVANEGVWYLEVSGRRTVLGPGVWVLHKPPNPGPIGLRQAHPARTAALGS